MTQILSNSHIDVIIDGSHRVQGIADEDRPYEFSGGDGLFNIQRSQADGGSIWNVQCRCHPGWSIHASLAAQFTECAMAD